MLNTETVDLTNCDREPIHIPGSIQPHGCLLACDGRAGTVLRHSINAAGMLGVEGPLIGRELSDLVGAETTHTIRNALASVGTASRASLVFAHRVRGGAIFDIAVHRAGEDAIVEFEPVEEPTQPLELARGMIGRIRDITNVDELIEQTARLVRGTLRYDRVMVYRFEQDGAGKVVSEVKRHDLESFLGQYFPASDIPQQARALYLKNTIRIISDAQCIRVPIEPELDAGGMPLDLSHAHLRSVSSIHCEYLRNMGVSASMSISVIVDGVLWGLIACHHYSPRKLPMAERVAAEMFGQFFSLQLEALKQRRKLDTATRARASLDRFLRLASHHGNVTELLKDHLPDLQRLIPCDGIGLWMNGTLTTHGSTPPPAAIPALASIVNASAGNGQIWATHCLYEHLPGAESYFEDASGVLALPISQIPRDYLFFFRKEVVQTLDWGGNPDKSYETGPLGDRLTPRKSFAIWKETVKMQAQPWTDSDREIAEAARSALVETVLHQSELMEEERSRADVRQRMLNEELNHRVKNILAVIKALVSHPVAEGRGLEEHVDSLKGRIQALAYAHDQVVRGDGGGMLGELINAEISPYRVPGTDIVLEGEPVWLDSRAFSIMALVLHELSTNAAKYGALSQPGGRLSIGWTMTPTGACIIEWAESGGPVVQPPSREGFGSALIKRGIPYDLGGRSEVDYASQGLKACFELPADYVAATTTPDGPQPAAPTQRDEVDGPVATLASDFEILLVEDQMLIAMDVEIMLADNGVSRVVTSGSVQDATGHLRDWTPDAAVLDVNLGSGTSLPIAEELSRRGVPFIFATGYGDRSMIPPVYAAVPIVRKPYEAHVLLSALASAVEFRQERKQ